MKKRKGQVMMQVLVMCAVIISVCVAITRQALQSRALQRKTVLKEEAFGNLEGVNARISACLSDSGYPVAHSCSPNASQRLCAPAGGTALVFSGDWPECRIKITIGN